MEFLGERDVVEGGGLEKVWGTMIKGFVPIINRGFLYVAVNCKFAPLTSVKFLAIVDLVRKWARFILTGRFKETESYRNFEGL